MRGRRPTPSPVMMLRASGPVDVWLWRSRAGWLRLASSPLVDYQQVFRRRPEARRASHSSLSHSMSCSSNWDADKPVCSVTAPQKVAWPDVMMALIPAMLNSLSMNLRTQAPPA